ncbi:nuclear transport factor 2 family protein [Bradyrhizobium sp. LLZ17]|uniref:Nuclear transport factor 2 family protein n=1 Tax=Bradyrhizobium sp. LLZ17 TaxID=3239388 RepID=A0AB39XAK2_9BRAD
MLLIEQETTMSSVGTQAQNAYVAPTAGQLAAARDIVARFAEKWDKPSADALRDLMHPETQNLIPPMTAPGNREAVVEHFRDVLRRLPDLRLEVVRWAPTDDAVMIEWQATASVAGQPLAWSGVDRFNVRGDRIYQANVYWDTRGLAERMAAVVAKTSAGVA